MSPISSVEKLLPLLATRAEGSSEPMPTSASATSAIYNVRFRIDHASDADIARLTQCLSRFPSVQGVNVEQPGGN